MKRRWKANQRMLLSFVFLCLTMKGLAGQTAETFPANDTIIIERKIISKSHKIKIYSDAKQEVLFFSAQGGHARTYQFYLFDIDGKLLRQLSIKNKNITLLENMEKGNYQFEVFSNDERIEAGHVSVI